MARRAVLSGEIEKDGATGLLRDIEIQRITGELRFSSVDGEVSGEISLIGGEIAVDQALKDGKDPVDLFLELDVLKYEVVQRLPDLPVSRGTDLERRGSLAIHVPVDLMSYCEHAGLTGVLELSHDGRKAEAFYQSGELTAIELDGSEIGDLQEVFAWEQGRFRICLDPDVQDRLADVPDEVAEEESEPSSYSEKGEQTSKFLHVVEMALTDVLDKSERARSPTRTSPPLPSPPERRPRPKSVPAPPSRPRKDQTVRLIYLTGDAAAPAPKVSTRHAQKGGAELAHIEARPERRAHEEPDPMAKKRRKKRGSKKKTQPARRKAAAEPKAPAKKKPKAEAARREEPDKDQKGSNAAQTKPKGEPERGADGKPAGPLDSWVGGLVWALGVVALGLVILAVLAQLPPVD